MQNHSIWISFSCTQPLWWWVANPCWRQGFDSASCDLEIGIENCLVLRPTYAVRHIDIFLYITSLLSYFLLSIGHHFGIIVGESSHQKLSKFAKSSEKVDLQGCKTFFFFFLSNFLWESCIIVVKESCLLSTIMLLWFQ